MEVLVDGNIDEVEWNASFVDLSGKLWMVEYEGT